MEFPLDKYTYQARLLPALIAITPIGFAVAVWFPREIAIWSWLGTLFISLGLAALLSQLGRDLGKGKEQWLFQQWGGIPTTKLLSHRLSRLNSTTLKRYHAKLQALLPELKIPTRSEEAQSPVSANHVYESCVHFLREKTRDRKEHPMVFAENVNYGFRRNLWAMKSIGVSASILSVFSCGASLIHRLHGNHFGLLLSIMGTATSAILLLLWVFSFNPNWVRVPAEAYAERLLGSLDAAAPDSN
jgi:hypothetical protein